MGSKHWMVFLMLAMALIASGTSNATPFSDAAASWGLTHQGQDMPGFDVEPEMLMDSVSNHRMLAQRRRYLSYRMLRADSIPCGRRGHSYYDCDNPRPANPYRRGCQVITRCYRYTH